MIQESWWSSLKRTRCGTRNWWSSGSEICVRSQPLDVTFNAEFKKSVHRLATEHLSANPESFMTGKVTAGDRRVLFTKWVGTAWQETSRRLKDPVIRSFVKCGIPLPIFCSRDSEINIDGLPDYRMGESADIEEIEFFSDSDEES